MLDATLSLTSSAGTRRVSLASYIDADAEERAHAQEYAWIKGLRNLPVDGASFRERFTARGDSLWWFSEVYLHKSRVVLEMHRALAGLTALLETERPASMVIEDGSIVLRHIASQLLPFKKVAGSVPVEASTWDGRLRAMDLRARRLNILARISPDRFRRPPRRPSPLVAAFVHRAFWTSGGEDGAAETYIGPVLRELEARTGPGGVHYVGVGPSTHFRAHRVWKLGRSTDAIVPVERYAPRATLANSREIWRQRGHHLVMMERSPALREWAMIGGIDTWPVVRELLAGIAWLQWPWSVRSMDEAGAALEALQPGAAVTYAEAGGWGRALILEARRRAIPTAGLQHGFIYRHWLNYLHEPDEMPDDERTGFPRPTRTLLFDAHAAEHLRTRGRFPQGSLVVTGSPGLDALVATVRQLAPNAVADLRRRLGVTGDIVLVTTKEREARPHLPALVDAAARLPGVTLVIKPHPAESALVYEAVTRSRGAVKVVDPGEPLAPLLASARAVVTVNSTVALDAGALGIPALAIGLPNNLSPFVEAGALAGSSGETDLAAALQRILYDEGFRQQLAERRALILGQGAQGAMTSDGDAALRAADTIRRLASGRAMQGRAETDR
jgi:hypothetical protein